MQFICIPGILDSSSALRKLHPFLSLFRLTESLKELDFWIK